MSFACWRRCDFQIHTPRDPNWTGLSPVGLGEFVEGTQAVAVDVDRARQAWARSFVDCCLAKGLEAVALTDHHEMVMISYVQEEIAKRQEADHGFDLWLFPGMELTAAGGKQCLILFDADLPIEWWKQAQGKLGISFAGQDDKAAKGSKVVQLRCLYPDIGAELDDIPELKGRYIILPNMSQGNRFTVLVEGGHTDFLRMPYVGGYLDQGQSIDTLSSRNRQRLSGEDSTWSNREIYPLPTSDCRSSDYKTLGEINTWIKLAAPTAEAIRQAFLCHRSRIRVIQPKLPTLAVVEAVYTGSSTMGETTVSLSSEFNAIIGGRGSGKSSFLEYVAFGLGRSCYDVPRDHYSGTTRMSALIKDTLVTKNGTVTIAVSQDNAEFRITRGPGTAYQPKIKYPNGNEQTVTVKELRALFPAVVYSQGELSEIGKQAGKRTQLADLLQFVNPDYKREDDRLVLAVDNAKGAVKNAIHQLATAWGDQARLRKLIAAKESLLQRAEALEKTLPALSDEDQAAVALFDKSDDFETKRLQASKQADSILAELQANKSDIGDEKDLSSDLTDSTKDFQQVYKSLFSIYHVAINNLEKDIREARKALTTEEAAWASRFKGAREGRDAALKKLGAHQTVTGQIIKLRQDMALAANEIADLETKISAVGDPARGLNVKLEQLKTCVVDRATRTEQWAAEIQKLSNGKIKAQVDAYGDTLELTEALDIVSAKTGSQESTRVRMLSEELVIEDVWTVLERLRSECLSTLYWSRMGSASGEDQPSMPSLMNLLGDTDRIRASLAEKLDDARVQALSCAVPKPEITLSYCDGDREISFEKASEGQRAAALLFMLLEQPGGPLIIDQPEGDLDNKIISDLTNKLHDAKPNRQLIFASHNANIVVNGSSELVGHLEVDGDGIRHFQCAGAIDAPSICKVITATMEGGAKAFKDRQDKYGY